MAPEASGTVAPVLRAHLAIVTSAVLFGSTFVVMKDAVVDAGPVPFLGVRFLIGAAVLVPLTRRGGPSVGVWRAGAVCGLALLSGYVFQTVGLQYVTASVSAFITYLLVMFVPLLSAVLLRERISMLTVIAVGLAVVGLFLLTGGAAGLGRGELFTVACALTFALHIILLDRYSPVFPTARLMAVQFLVVGGLCAVAGPFTGGFGFGRDVWLAAAYTGVAASAVALSLQTWGQRQVGPTRTALLLLIEPVSAAVLGYLAGERLGWRGVAGAVTILGAVALAEVPVLRRMSPRSNPSA